jgi:hypothetical protein
MSTSNRLFNYPVNDLNFSISFEVSSVHLAACSLKSQLRHNIDEHDSGEMTEYQQY